MPIFAKTCSLLEKESSNLKKVEIISENVLKFNSQEEMALFCVYLTGNVYPSNIQRSIHVGKAWVRDAVINITNKSKQEWNDQYREYGDIGLCTESLLSDNISTQNNIISDDKAYDKSSLKEVPLTELKELIEDLYRNSSSKKKTQLIADFLIKLSPQESKYLVKLLTGRLRIGVQEASVENSISKAFGIESKKVKQLNFYLGDIGEVAVRCKERDFENVEFRLFHPIKAMLASSEVEIEDMFKRFGDKIWTEYKYDGMRAHIHYEKDQVEIFTRDLKNVTSQFPEVVEKIKKASHSIKEIESFLIDGEIVAFQEGKVMPFSYLQKRLGRKENIDKIAKENPCDFIAYDFLYFNKETLFEYPLKERREKLEQIFNSQLMYSSKAVVSSKEEFRKFFQSAKTLNLEGVMIKGAESKYESGKRGIQWLKYKETLDPLDVIVLSAEYGEGRNAKYLSNLTFGVLNKENKEITPIGRVYSGLTEEQLKELTPRFLNIQTEKIENGVNLKPEVILEVGFENIQKSERYSSGYAVRFPRVLRERTGDKPLDEISTLSDVENAFKKINNS